MSFVIETSGKILFPDDDILIRLRQKAGFYREHLRYRRQAYIF